MASNIGTINLNARSYHKPIEHGNAVYVCGIDSTNNYEIDCMKSTTPSTGSWTEQDAVDVPADGVNPVLAMAYKQNKANARYIDIAWVSDSGGGTGTNYRINYARFDMDTDSWVTADEATGLETTTVTKDDTLAPYIDIDSNSDDDLIILGPFDSEKEMGIDFARVGLWRHNTGGSWTELAANSFDSNQSNAQDDWYAGAIAYNDTADKQWNLYYTDDTDLYRKALSDGTNLSTDLGTRSTVQTTLGTTARVGNAVYWNDGTNDYDGIIYYDNASGRFAYETNQGGTWTERATEDTASHSAVADDATDTIYAIGTTSGLGLDVHYRESDNGAAFGSATEIEDAVTQNAPVSANVIDYGSGKVLAVVYNNGTTARYAEISVGSTTHSLTGTTATTLSTTTSLNKKLPVTGTTATTLSTTTQLNRQLPLTGTTATTLSTTATLIRVLALAGTTATTVSTSGQLNKQLPLVGTTATTLSTSTTLNQDLTVTGTTATTLSTTTTLSPFWHPTGTTATTLSTTATVDVGALHSITGTTATVLSTTTQLNRQLPLVGTTATVLSTTTDLNRTIPATGTTATTVSTTGQLNRLIPATGTTATALSTTATMDVGLLLSATGTTATALSATTQLNRALPLTSTTSTVLSTNGQLNQNIPLASTSATVVSSTGQLNLLMPVTGTTATTLSTTATLIRLLNLVGTTTTVASTTAALNLLHGILGTTPTTVSTTVIMSRNIPVTGTTATVLSTIGTLTGGTQWVDVTGGSSPIWSNVTGETTPTWTDVTGVTTPTWSDE